jgi:hypothetical protein
VEVRSEKGSLIAAGPGANLDDGGAVVQRIMGDEKGADIDLESANLRLEPVSFRASLRGEVGIVTGRELLRFQALGVASLEARGDGHHPLQALVLPA